MQRLLKLTLLLGSMDAHTTISAAKEARTGGQALPSMCWSSSHNAEPSTTIWSGTVQSPYQAAHISIPWQAPHNAPGRWASQGTDWETAGLATGK